MVTTMELYLSIKCSPPIAEISTVLRLSVNPIETLFPMLSSSKLITFIVTQIS